MSTCASTLPDKEKLGGHYCSGLYVCLQTLIKVQCSNLVCNFPGVEHVFVEINVDHQVTIGPVDQITSRPWCFRNTSHLESVCVLHADTDDKSTKCDANPQILLRNSYSQALIIRTGPTQEDVMISSDS